MIKSWMVIAAVTFLVALASSLTRSSDVKWFNRLRRPQWLVFEAAIPLIWTIIFVCGAWSAYIVWEQNPGTSNTWFLMGFYLIVEMAIIAYTPVMFRLRSLKVGTVIGATGFILGLILAILVFRISGWAFLLLVPYLIWSPIGTYTTWDMISLNPEDA